MEVVDQCEIWRLGLVTAHVTFILKSFILKVLLFYFKAGYGTKGPKAGLAD